MFCGTAPGRVSATRGAYYAGPGNRFWPTLHAIGLTPHRFSPDEYPQLLHLGIGLTDLAKHSSGQDADLPADAFDPAALRAKIQALQPAYLAFTSLHGGRSFLGQKLARAGEQPEPVGVTRIWLLPSPSGLATRSWSIEPWQQLAACVRPPETGKQTR